MSESERDKELDGFTSRALRRNKSGSYEQLLAQHLIRSVEAPTANKIRLICEAAMMVPDSPVDKNVLDLLYRVATSFSEARIDMPGDRYDFHGAILWGFPRTQEGFQRYVIPWLPTDDQLYMSTSHGSEESRDKINEMEWGAEKFYQMTQRLHIAGFVKLETRFTVWAMPQAMEVFEKLAKLVNPDTYQKVLEVMH